MYKTIAIIALLTTTVSLSACRTSVGVGPSAGVSDDHSIVIEELQ